MPPKKKTEPSVKKNKNDKMSVDKKSKVEVEDDPLAIPDFLLRIEKKDKKV